VAETGDAPILEFDPAREAIIEPTAVPYLKRRGPAPAMPVRVVLRYSHDVIGPVREAYGAMLVATPRSEIGPNGIYELEHAGVRIAVARPGVRAPLAAGFLEELIASGSDLRRFRWRRRGRGGRQDLLIPYRCAQPRE
jgi:hypothetical protein